MCASLCSTFSIAGTPVASLLVVLRCRPVGLPALRGWPWRRRSRASVAVWAERRPRTVVVFRAAAQQSLLLSTRRSIVVRRVCWYHCSRRVVPSRRSLTTRRPVAPLSRHSPHRHDHRVTTPIDVHAADTAIATTQGVASVHALRCARSGHCSAMGRADRHVGRHGAAPRPALQPHSQRRDAHMSFQQSENSFISIRNAAKCTPPTTTTGDEWGRRRDGAD